MTPKATFALSESPFLAKSPLSCFSIGAQRIMVSNGALTNLTAVWNTEVFCYTMAYTPCFEDIRNQSGRFCEMSFLKAGVYCKNKCIRKILLTKISSLNYYTSF